MTMVCYIMRFYCLWTESIQRADCWNIMLTGKEQGR